jgi:hypothetical protein
MVGYNDHAVTNLVQWTSSGVSRACDDLRMWCVHLVMMVSTDAIGCVSTDAIGCGGFGGVVKGGRSGC